MPGILIQLIWLLFFIAILGVCVWAIRTYVPMDESIAKVFNAVVVIACIVAVIVLVFYLLSWLLGIAGGSSPSAFPFPPSHPR